MRNLYFSSNLPPIQAIKAVDQVWIDGSDILMVEGRIWLFLLAKGC